MGTDRLHDQATEAQMRDMGSMRTEHEAEIMALVFEALDTDRDGTGKLGEALSAIRLRMEPLFDAKYGPLHPVAAIRYPRPTCVICGATVTEIGPFCVDCLEECPECAGSGYVAEPRGNGGQDAIESPCGRCK